MNVNAYVNVDTLPPLGLARHMLYEQVQIRRDLVAPKAIREARDRAADKMFREMSVNPFFCSAFVITVMGEDDAEPEVFYDLHERENIRKLALWADAFKRETGGAIVWNTYNGLNFDYPILRLRAVKYGFGDLAREMSCPRWGDARHVDWFQKLGAPRLTGGPIRGTLDLVAKFWGLPDHGNTIFGDGVLDAHEAGHVQTILTHARSRVLILRDVVRHVTNMPDMPVMDQEVADDQAEG